MKNIVFLVLLNLMVFQVMEASAADTVPAEPITTIANIPSAPKHLADPSLNPSTEALPEWTENGIIDLTKECKKIKWIVQNIVSFSSSCKNDSDCVQIIAGSDTPFGCPGIFVDKKHTDRVTHLLHGYQELCGISWSMCEFPPNKILCEKFRCVGKN